MRFEALACGWWGGEAAQEDMPSSITCTHSLQFVSTFETSNPALHRTSLFCGALLAM